MNRSTLFFLVCFAGVAAGCAAGTDPNAADESAESGDEAAQAARVADPRTTLREMTFPLDAHAVSPALESFRDSGDHLVMDVPFAPVNAIARTLNDALHVRLKDRGEAHVTVITPPEASAMRSKLSVRDMNAIATHLDIQHSDFEPLCVGVGVARSNRALQTYFVVVASENLFAIRREIQREFVARGGSARAFDANAFTPHVTIAFTQRDLFEQDGVAKTTSSCPNARNLRTE